MRAYIGIDPGVSGAAAVLNAAGHLIAIHDLTVERVGKNRMVQGESLFNFLVLWETKITDPKIVLEQQNPRPAMGAHSCFLMGVNYGTVFTVVRASAYPVTLVSPNKWKQEMHLKKTKGMSVREHKEMSLSLARREFGNAHGWFDRFKDHDRAEAALLALWARQRNV